MLLYHCIPDLNFSVSFVSDAARHMLGRNPEHLVGKPFCSRYFFHADDVKFARQQLNILGPRSSTRFTCRMRAAGNSFRCMEIEAIGLPRQACHEIVGCCLESRTESLPLEKPARMSSDQRQKRTKNALPNASGRTDGRATTTPARNVKRPKQRIFHLPTLTGPASFIHEINQYLFSISNYAAASLNRLQPQIGVDAIRESLLEIERLVETAGHAVSSFRSQGHVRTINQPWLD